jgi:CBS domain-containing protein
VEKECGGVVLKVSDLMSKNVVTIGADASVADAAKKMRDANVGSIVVLDHNEVKGIVTDRKIVTTVIAENKDPGREKIGNITSKGLVTCNENSDIHDALMTIAKNKIRRCPVINDKKELVGVVSIADIASEMRGCMDALFDDISRSSHKAGHSVDDSRPVLR